MTGDLNPSMVAVSNRGEMQMTKTNRIQFTQWQMLVIEQLVEHAVQFESHKYHEASIKNLLEVIKDAKSITVTK